MYEIGLSILGVYAISSLLSEYSGFKNIFMKLRDMGMPDCLVCLSVWVAVPFAIFAGIDILGYFGVLGGVIVLSRVQ